MRAGVRIAIALLALAALGLATRSVAKSPRRQLFGRIVDHADVTERRVALTFDDGPADAALDTILNILAARQVRATFFVTGGGMHDVPRAGRALVAAGHELGNHSYSHRHMLFMRPSTVRREVERTDSLIRAAGHQGTVFFRPPYGVKLVVLPWYLSRTNRTTVTWDVATEAYPPARDRTDSLVARTLAAVRPGSIILLHPWYPSRAATLAAIAPLIDSLHSRGYAIGPVRDLLRQANR